jgi:GntR family transcriptional regulator, transcriptional repressor for pyruvate dehydrogenase complex
VTPTRKEGNVMTVPAITLLQSMFVRLASKERTDDDLRSLRQSVDRASDMKDAWEDRAAAHAEFHCLLADATRAASYSLVARCIQDSMRDMIASAGQPEGDRIIAAHRQLIFHLQARDADSAVWEMRRYLAQLAQAQSRPLAAPAARPRRALRFTEGG